MDESVSNFTVITLVALIKFMVEFDRHNLLSSLASSVDVNAYPEYTDKKSIVQPIVSSRFIDNILNTRCVPGGDVKIQLQRRFCA